MEPVQDEHRVRLGAQDVPHVADHAFEQAEPEGLDAVHGCVLPREQQLALVETANKTVRVPLAQPSDQRVLPRTGDAFDDENPRYRDAHGALCESPCRCCCTPAGATVQAWTLDDQLQMLMRVLRGRIHQYPCPGPGQIARATSRRSDRNQTCAGSRSSAALQYIVSTTSGMGT